MKLFTKCLNNISTNKTSDQVLFNQSGEKAHSSTFFYNYKRSAVAISLSALLCLSPSFSSFAQPLPTISESVKVLTGNDEDGAFLFVCDEVLSDNCAADRAGSFILDRTEWLDIQKFVQIAYRLPNTEAKIKTAFGIDVVDSHFESIRQEYQKVNDSADKWNSYIYPEIVGLAKKMLTQAEEHSVATDRLSADLGGLKAVIEEYLSAVDAYQIGIMLGFPSEQRKNQLYDIINNKSQIIRPALYRVEYELKKLEGIADRNYTGADDLLRELNNFYSEVESEKESLIGLGQTNAEILKREDGRYKALDEQVKEARGEFEEFQQALKDCASQASDAAPAGKNFVVTIFSLGINQVFYAITDILLEKECRDKVRPELQDSQENYFNLLAQSSYQERVFSTYDNAKISIDEVVFAMDEALPHFNKIKDNWQTLTLKLQTLKTTVGTALNSYSYTELDELTAIYSSNSQVEDIHKNWQDVRVIAADFLNFAYMPVVIE